MADLVDDLVPETGLDRAVEKVLVAVDRDDLVLVVAAVEVHGPGLGPMADREVDPAVLHFPMLTIGGDAMPAVAGIFGSNNRLFVFLLYTSTTTSNFPNSVKSDPTFR